MFCWCSYFRYIKEKVARLVLRLGQKETNINCQCSCFRCKKTSILSVLRQNETAALIVLRLPIEGKSCTVSAQTFDRVKQIYTLIAHASDERKHLYCKCSDFRWKDTSVLIVLRLQLERNSCTVSAQTLDSRKQLRCQCLGFRQMETDVLLHVLVLRLQIEGIFDGSVSCFINNR